MFKEREEDLLWDTITLLKDQNHFENASALFKSLIERTFSALKMPTSFLEEAKIDLPSNEIVSLFRSLDKEINRSLKRSDTIRAYESLLEYIEKLSEVIPETDQKQILAKLLAEKSQRPLEIILPRFEFAIPVAPEQAEVYTSSEAAEIIGVSDQTIRRWCEKGKYPNAYQTDGGHWRIPKRHFKVTLEEARKREEFEQLLNKVNAKHGEVAEDEFL